MRKQNTKDTQYNRDMDLRGSSSVGWTTERGGGVNQLLSSLNNIPILKLFAETLNDDHNNAGK
jgi:hypothetical protein